LVCRCEDVTLDDLRAGLAAGCATVDELKRLTGLGTGPCQGKECQAHVARLLEPQVGASPSLQPFTARPPFCPTPIRLFASLSLDVPPMDQMCKTAPCSRRRAARSAPAPTWRSSAAA
jgi:sarcosine oxidase subunit beta